ncbi:MAG: YybH family protein [Terriglobales bacterium]|jgi:ketosteroid isomerase-like protein
MHVKRVLLFAILVVSAVGCLAQTKAQERDRQAIAKTEAEFQKARVDRGLEGWLSFFADDTADFTRGKPFSFTKDEMRKRLEKDFDPADQLTWKAARIEVARSGDLAYSLGTWHLKGKNPKGEEVEQTGKYLTVWKKQKDGSWKVVADTGNVDPPAKKG